MAVEFQFEFPLVHGLHARPASHFEEVAGGFASAISLHNERTGRTASAKSVLSMVGTDTRKGDQIKILIDGSDEQAALTALKKFVSEVLPVCDNAIEAVSENLEQLPLPRSLKATGLTSYLQGKPVCRGVGRGRVVMASGLTLPAALRDETAADPARELEKANQAIAAVGAEIQAKISAAVNPQESAVLSAHAAIANDPALKERIDKRILSHRQTAAQAVADAAESFSAVLRNAGTAYLRERVLDVQDVCGQLLDRIMGGTLLRGIVLKEPSICVADRLTPGQFLSLDRRYLRGLVLSEGEATSHTVILARSMNVPTLVGVQGATATVANGRQLIVDGNLGLAIPEPSPAVRRYYARELQTLRKAERRLRLTNVSGTTLDGRAVEIGANIASAEEVSLALKAGAHGIGLFRTEMLFMDRPASPTEEEQTAIYSAAGAAARGRSVIIRLLDIGGDKPAPYLKLPQETNPFLGYRGVRLYEEFSELIQTQLRAILRASGSGELKIMIPMVCCVEEIRAVRAMLIRAQQELAARGIVIDRLPPLGAMIEIPSTAFIMPELCAEADFFSIGSNDLTQYFLAADRNNSRVASIYAWSHPAFLRMLKSLVQGAHAGGKWIGLCGEMGDSDAALSLLIGAELDEISVSLSRVRQVRSAIGSMRFDRCAALLASATACATRADVETLLEKSDCRDIDQPLLSPDLVIRVNGATKEEVIKDLSDALYLTGRVSRPHLIEEALWRREDVYSTGFGGGFAIPHCKSEHLSASSIIIARLDKPVTWGSLDGEPVDVIILLAMRAQEHEREHMKTFSRLSRMVMRDEFRDRIRQEKVADHLVAFLRQSLEMAAA